MEVGVVVTGDQKVALRFEKFPEQARAKLKERITGLTNRLEALVRGAVPDRSGQLKSEVQAFVDDDSNKVSGKVKVVAPDVNALRKALSQEYGAHGSHGRAKVSAYSQSRSTVYGRLMSTQDVAIKAYTRLPNIQAQRFMRGPLEAMRGDILAELKLAMAEAAAEQP